MLKDEFEIKKNNKKKKGNHWVNPSNSWSKLWDWNNIVKNKLRKIIKYNSP